MAPPDWLDEHGQRRPTRQCWKCVREEPVIRLHYKSLRMIGWKPLGTVYAVNYSGHGNECVPWPEPDGYWRLVSVWEP